MDEDLNEGEFIAASYDYRPYVGRVLDLNLNSYPGVWGREKKAVERGELKWGQGKEGCICMKDMMCDGVSKACARTVGIMSKQK